MPESPPLLRMNGISKRFGPTRALHEVSLDVHPGQVLALIGENGAGKSTLMKVLAGALRPDAGQMRLGERPYRPVGPSDAQAAGVAMIYQELNLAPDLSVEDNVMLGREEHRWGWIRRRSQRTRVRDALDVLGHRDLNPSATVGRLSVGAQQLVEIARALVFQARVIVFDEPTSSLPRKDVEHLFQVVRKLKASGIGVVYISHFLEEVREVADHFQVLRDGRNAGDGALTDATDEQIVSYMVGRNVDELFPRVPHEPQGEVLRLKGICGRSGMPTDVDFSLRRGEILGIAGLVGAGRTELMRCIFGLDAVRRGQVTIAGVASRHSPRGRIRAGVGLLSEDRKSEGLAQQLSVADNITLSRLPAYSMAGCLNLKRRRRHVNRLMADLQVKARSADQEVQYLSGGNQQKVALARVLHQDADVLLLDEPTRGIDVGTKAEIYRLAGQLAAQGKAIIFVSSYLPELLAVCDRIGVMARGRLREIRPVDQWTEESVMTAAIATEAKDHGGT